MNLKSIKRFQNDEAFIFPYVAMGRNPSTPQQRPSLAYSVFYCMKPRPAQLSPLQPSSGLATPYRSPIRTSTQVNPITRSSDPSTSLSPVNLSPFESVTEDREFESSSR
jgi:hypothetical protein